MFAFAAHVDAIPVASTLDILDLEMTAAAFRDGRLVGQVKNATDRTLSLPTLRAVCFDEGAHLLSHHVATLTPNRVEPGQTATVHIQLGADEPCPRVLTAAMGFDL